MNTTIPFPSEKFIEDFVYNTIINTGICPVSNESVDSVFRQLDLGAYGIADIVKVSAQENPFENEKHYVITVLELKNADLKSKDLSQLARYMTGIDRYIEKYNQKMRFTYEIYGELGGLRNGDNDICYLSKYLENIGIYTLSATLTNGFLSNIIGDGWYKIDEDYKKISKHLKSVVRGEF